MKKTGLVEEYLEEEPKFRERSNKDRGIVNLLMNHYGALKSAIESGAIGKDTIIAIVQDYASMDRTWRKALAENPKWRGKDYDDKDQLESQKISELGYNTPRNVGPAPATERGTQTTLL